jgi:hypothetical protein
LLLHSSLSLALAPQPPTDLPSPTSLSISTIPSIRTQIEHVNLGRTETTALTSTATATPIYLPVTASPPDPIGIARVNGFYGPGAWAAWFLTVVAAWWRILRLSGKKFDLNTWLFLLGTNWAAVDIFRGIHSLRMIPTDHAEYGAQFSNYMGSFGAAFIVVYWGTVHALLQIQFTIAAFENLNCRRQRVWTLIIGLTLPLIALFAAFAYMLGPVLNGRASDGIDLLPALYWSGMTDEQRQMIFVCEAFAVFFVAPSALAYTFIADESLLPNGLVAIIRTVINLLQSKTIVKWIMGIYDAISIVFFVVSVVVSAVLSNVTNNEYWLWGMAPFFALLLLVFLPLLLVYDYLYLGRSARDICFQGVSAHRFQCVRVMFLHAMRAAVHHTGGSDVCSTCWPVYFPCV